MNKDNSARASFAGLRPDRSKENNLSFYNHKEPTYSYSQTLLVHEPILNKRKTNFGHFKNNEFQKISTNSSKFSNAIKQMNNRQKRNNTNSGNILQQTYLRTQQAIKYQIQQYNAKYTEVTQILADMHIKDLMKFNEMLQKNQQIYYKYQQESQYIVAGQSFNFYQSSFEDSRKIYQTEKAIMKIISEPTKSFDFRSTYQSKKNTKTVSGGSSRVSPQLTKVQISQKMNKNSQKLSKLTDSDKNNYGNHSKISKSGSVQDEKRCNFPAIQDTPQSVKSKISCTTKIKADKEINIGMFDRINVCESVQQMILSQEPESFRNKSQRQKQKKQHRYGKYEDEV